MLTRFFLLLERRHVKTALLQQSHGSLMALFETLEMAIEVFWAKPRMYEFPL